MILVRTESLSQFSLNLWLRIVRISTLYLPFTGLFGQVQDVS